MLNTIASRIAIILRSAVDLARGCINTGPGSGNYLALGPNLRRQAIVPSYRLDCNAMCGNITSWMIYAVDTDRRRRETNELLARGSRSIPSAGSATLLGIQVWRPLPPIYESEGTGCYRLVGSQGISSINLNNGGLAPPVPCDIPFQPGDVLGFYVNIPDTDNHDHEDIEIRRAGGDEIVWYSDNQMQIAPTIPTEYFIGNNPRGDLDRSSSRAPAISIAISK